MNSPREPYPDPAGRPQDGQPPEPRYGQPLAGIAVTTRYPKTNWGEWLFSKPKIYVDGYEMPVRGWGRTVLPTWPGIHNVHVRARSPIRGPNMGVADATVQVFPGQLVELDYQAPYFGASAGALGIGRQRPNGRGIMTALIAVPLALTVLMIIMGIVLALMH